MGRRGGVHHRQVGQGIKSLRSYLTLNQRKPWEDSLNEATNMLDSIMI